MSNLGSEVAMQLDLHDQSTNLGIGYQENLRLLHGSEVVPHLADSKGCKGAHLGLSLIHI